MVNKILIKTRKVKMRNNVVEKKRKPRRPVCRPVLLISDSSCDEENWIKKINKIDINSILVSMRTCLYNLLVSLNRSVTRISKTNNYYPPKLNLDKNQDTDSLLVELNKLSTFLRAPEFSYLYKKNENFYDRFN